MKTPRNPADLHQPLAPYSHQIDVVDACRWLVMSGQIGMRADDSVPDDAADQFDVALQNVLHNLAAAELDPTDLVKLTLYLVDEIPPAARAEILQRHLGAAEPCMTLTYVPRLAAPHLRVELDAWAAR